MQAIPTTSPSVRSSEPLTAATLGANRPHDTRGISRAAGLSLSLLALGLAVPAGAQTPAAGASGPPDVVSWSVAPAPKALRPGARTALTLRGALQPGWHVYGLAQADGGPTPLRVSLSPNPVASADGATAGSRPIRELDPAFRLQTQYYASAFTLTVPVRVADDARRGAQQIPLAVRYQTCNGEICHPPKTVRLAAPVTVAEK